MTNSEDECRGYVMHLRREHEGLREQLSRLQAQWPSLKEARKRKTELDPFVALLAAFRANLAHHFQEEWTGGCLEEAASLNPTISHDITCLEHQHGQLLREIDQFGADIQACNWRKPAWQRLDESFRRFCTTLLQHEADENRILRLGFGIEQDP